MRPNSVFKLTCLIAGGGGVLPYLGLSIVITLVPCPLVAESVPRYPLEMAICFECRTPVNPSRSSLGGGGGGGPPRTNSGAENVSLCGPIKATAIVPDIVVGNEKVL